MTATPIENPMPYRDTIHVACVADQRFYEGARVSLISLVSCATGTFDYCLHLFSNDMSDDSVSIIDSACRSIALRKGISVTLVYHKVREEDISILPIRRGSRMTYLRLMIPELLSQLDEITYIDTDTLFLAGIEDFQSNLNKNGSLLAGARDYYATLENECHWMAELSPEERKSPYINAGICRMNLAAMREMQLLAKALELLKDHHAPRYVDQSLLNFLCRGKIEVFDNKYNFVVDMRANQNLNKCDIMKNFHYIGKIKPWRGAPTVKNWLASNYWHVAADIYSGGSGEARAAKSTKVFKTMLKLCFCAIAKPKSFRLHRENLRSLSDPSGSISLARKKLLELFASPDSSNSAVAHARH